MKISNLFNYEAKSLQEGFDALSDDDKARVLIDDEIHLSMDFYNPEIVNKDDMGKVYAAINTLNTANSNDKESIEKSVIEIVSTLKKYPNIKTYQIMHDLGCIHEKLGMDQVEFVKKYILLIHIKKLVTLIKM